jgi:hypothetical protein
MVAGEKTTLTGVVTRTELFHAKGGVFQPGASQLADQEVVSQNHPPVLQSPFMLRLALETCPQKFSGGPGGSDGRFAATVG